jgi:predicted transcriptional regulator
MTGAGDDDSRIELTAEVVAAYVANNNVAAAALPELIRTVHTALARTAGAAAATAAPPAEPAVPARKSVMSDHIVCLEDGLKFKSLKRHLRTAHDMTPQQYREKWGLPANYPMVAPSYAKARSALARQMGLGRKGGRG